jgi:CelD/BcsL family acetyltransferase involved in cellulose biosynthesis
VVGRGAAARLLFARREGTDLAYILGGVLGYTYRGLQFSFSQDHKRLSLGNLCQYHQIARLCEEGIDLYDLGVDVEYKRRWGETRRDTVTLVAVPR